MWAKPDLNIILDHGDGLFKTVGLDRSLYLDELPENVIIADCAFNVKRVALETSEIRINKILFPGMKGLK